MQTLDDYIGVLDEIDALGLTEEFDLFLFMMHVRFGFPLVLYNNRLVRPARQGYTLSEREIDVIREYNQIDLGLYELAKRRFTDEADAIWSDEIEHYWTTYKAYLTKFRLESGGDVNKAQKLDWTFQGQPPI